MRTLTYFAVAIIGSLIIGSFIAPPFSYILGFLWGYNTRKLVDALLGPAS